MKCGHRCGPTSYRSVSAKRSQLWLQFEAAQLGFSPNLAIKTNKMESHCAMPLRTESCSRYLFCCCSVKDKNRMILLLWWESLSLREGGLLKESVHVERNENLFWEITPIEKNSGLTDETLVVEDSPIFNSFGEMWPHSVFLSEGKIPFSSAKNVATCVAFSSVRAYKNVGPHLLTGLYQRHHNTAFKPTILFALYASWFSETN